LKERGTNRMHQPSWRGDADDLRVLIDKCLAAGKTALDEWESKRLFASYGIPVPDGALVASEPEAVQAAALRGT
jgi:acyl-CoA synthetase (NDP forming)